MNQSANEKGMILWPERRISRLPPAVHLTARDDDPETKVGHKRRQKSQQQQMIVSRTSDPLSLSPSERQTHT